MRASADDRIDLDPTVAAAAAALGVRGRRGLRLGIVEAAVERVHGWVDVLGEAPGTLDDVLDLVANFTRVKIVELKSDEDLADVMADYGPDAAAVGVQLDLEFGQGETEALVLRRPALDRRGAPFVAVVDARGPLANRAWFAARHEPCHPLTCDPSMSAVWRRRRGEASSPIEMVVDATAAEVGFWGPIVGPALTRHLRAASTVLEAFEFARLELAPQASREACYRAFGRYVDRPLVVMYCDEGPKECDRGLGLLAESSALRAITVIRNAAARAHSLFVPENYRIPPHSAIHLARSSHVVLRQEDRLSRWTSSSGGRLADIAVRVTARGRWATMELQ